MSSIVIELKNNSKRERIEELKKDLHKLNQVSVMDNFGAYRDIIKSIRETKEISNKNCIEMLKDIAEQLNKWSVESREGGWSTQQEKPMIELSRDIYAYIGRNK
jgi:hypothetical protein